MKKSLIFIIMLAVFNVGCQNQLPPSDQETPPGEEEPATPGLEEPVEEPEQGLLDELEEMVETENAGAAEIGRFIRERAAEASSWEMDSMIEKLVLYQGALADEVNQKIYTQAYMKALNETMGGVLTPANVDDIENEEARNDFQRLVDAHMKVVRYEETPVVETDWEALLAYEHLVSEDFSAMLRLWEKIQNSGYGRQEIAFEDIIEDLVKTERIIQSNEVSFLTWQLNRLYERQVYSLFVGTEGSYMDTFVNKKSDLHTTLLNGAADYPETRFVQLVETLENSEATDHQTMTDHILNFYTFGVKGNGEIVKERLDGGESLGGLFYVHLPQDPVKEESVNNLINQVAESMALPEESTLNNYIAYGNDHYLSLLMFGSYTTEGGEFRFREEMVTINLDTLERETLRNMLEREGSNVSITEMFPTAPYDIDNFVIEGPGLRLMWQVEGQEHEEYGRMWFYDLERYLRLEKLYR